MNKNTVGALLFVNCARHLASTYYIYNRFSLIFILVFIYEFFTKYLFCRKKLHFHEHFYNSHFIKKLEDLGISKKIRNGIVHKKIKCTFASTSINDAHSCFVRKLYKVWEFLTKKQ